jgi:tRNA pseudouridine32 synthase/23S rRNA pseudouridine746 synthase
MIPVLYEDNDLIAVDKPAGIASIPERDRSAASVLSLLEKQLARKLFIVHRLDKEASGVMLFARTAAAHRSLNEAFFNRNVHKTYRTLVLGAVREDKGEIDAPIRQFGSGRMGVDEKTGTEPDEV